MLNIRKSPSDAVDGRSPRHFAPGKSLQRWQALLPSTAATKVHATKKLDLIQQQIFASVNEDGMISFPQGSARAIEAIFKVMESMARQGYLEYVCKTWYRAYWLTKKGWRTFRTLRSHQRPALSL